MKKILLALLAFTPGLSYAQLPVESFEGDWEPVEAAVGGPSDWLWHDNGIGLVFHWEQSEITPAITAYDGEHVAYINRENVPSTSTPPIDYLITPQFNVEQDAVLRFFSRLTQQGIQESIYRVMIIPEGTDVMAVGDYILLQEWNEEQINPEQLEYQEHLLGMPAEYIGTNIRLVFVMEGDFQDRWLLDLVSVGDECVAPFGLEVQADNTVEGAMFSWDIYPFMPESWEIAIVPQGMEPGGNVIAVNEMPYEFPEISEGSYDFYVRTACTETSSDWAGPVSFEVGEQTANTITGSVSYDVDEDGTCEAGEGVLPLTQVLISLDGQVQSVYTNAQGEYILFDVPDGENAITISHVPGYGFTELPAISETITFIETETSFQGNFCYEAPEPYSDLTIIFVPLNEARPGFDAFYNLVVINNGTGDAEDIPVSLAFDDLRLDFVNTQGYSLSNSQISLTVDSVEAFSSYTEQFTFYVLPPETNMGGEVVKFAAQIAATQEDVTPADNLCLLNQTLVNSYDPNDITVHEGAEILEEQADDYLTYTIRFQNTGTASAIHIRLENMLDDLLDWNTFEPLVSSHNYTVTRTGNMLEFRYDNIFLADSTSNEPESHGFVTYRIKPKPEFGLGDIVSNTAGIFFDFNPPVITNTATTEVVPPASLPRFTSGIASVYPNPVKNELSIDILNGTLESVRLFDMYGRESKVKEDNGRLRMSAFAEGPYVVWVTTTEGTQVFKILKQ